MRLWHYKLIPFLPNSQLLAQWRELNSIFKKQDKHILINYVYEYPKENLRCYTDMVADEMIKRGIEIRTLDNYLEYFRGVKSVKMDNPFAQTHNTRYLLQCFYNLQEKYDRGQKDFDCDRYYELEAFVKEQV